ncbi:MAG: potassium transporter TrkG, partial [Pseudomonadota bacterium]
MLSVIFYFACVGTLMTVSLLGPIGVALLGGEMAIAQRFSVYALLAAFVFVTPIIAIRGRLGPTPQVARLLLVVVVWCVLPLFAAVPFMDLANLTFMDALFEAVSGLTTTGASTLKTVEVWPQALLFWRVQLQWLGGYLALLTIVMIVAPLGIGGLTARTAVLINKGDLVLGQGRVLGFASNLGLVYLLITGACVVLLFLSGHRAYFSVTLAMTSVSTGGFLPFDGSLDEFVSPFGLVIMGAFLLLGATSVFWQRMILKGRSARVREHRESYFVMGLAGVLTLVFAFRLAQLYGGGLAPFGSGMVEGFLAASSLVATSGIESRPGVLSLLPLVLVLFIVLVGGSAYSTSGGLKQYRIGGMLVQSWSELDRLIYPHGVRPSHF